MAGPLKGIEDETVRALGLRNFAAVLQAFHRTTQKDAAGSLGIAPSTLQEFKDDHLERAMQVIAAIGLKVVNKNEQTIAVDEKRQLLKAQIRVAQRDLDELPDTIPGDL